MLLFFRTYCFFIFPQHLDTQIWEFVIYLSNVRLAKPPNNNQPTDSQEHITLKSIKTTPFHDQPEPITCTFKILSNLEHFTKLFGMLSFGTKKRAVSPNKRRFRRSKSSNGSSTTKARRYDPPVSPAPRRALILRDFIDRLPGNHRERVPLFYATGWLILRVPSWWKWTNSNGWNFQVVTLLGNSSISGPKGGVAVWRRKGWWL